MTYWIIPADPRVYNVDQSFNDHSTIDWRQGRNQFQIGDIIFIYLSGNVGFIQYKCVVDAINLSYANIRNDQEYYYNPSDYDKTLDGKFMHLALLHQIDNISLSYANLKANGLNSKIQGPLKVKGKLFDYIISNFSKGPEGEIFPELINDEDVLFEGIKKQVIVNKYERSAIARTKCLKFHEPICSVCDMNFLEKYGEIGKDFIHIHHLIPIHTIGIKYQINYKMDLIPVCPNCHAMLHRKINGKEPKVDELKKMINNRTSLRESNE